MQDAEACHDERTECQQPWKLWTPPRCAPFRECLAQILSHFSKFLTNEKSSLEDIRNAQEWCSFHSARISVRSGAPLCVSSSRNPSRFRRRDHDGKDRVRVVMKPGAVNMLDARQVHIRQLVINLWRPLRMFTTRKSLSMYATSLVPTSCRGTTTRFQMQPHVPIFCDIRIARAVSTSASLEFELSCNVDSACSRLDFPSCDCLLQPMVLGSGCAAHVQLDVMPVPWQLCCPCAAQLAC